MLTKLKSVYVSKKTLAQCVYNAGFDQFLYMGNSDVKNEAWKNSYDRCSFYKKCPAPCPVNSFVKKAVVWSPGKCDNMTNIELAVNMLGEVTAASISKQEQTKGFEADKDVVVRSGKIANNAKREYEKVTGLKAVFSLNAQNDPAL